MRSFTALVAASVFLATMGCSKQSTQATTVVCTGRTPPDAFIACSDPGGSQQPFITPTITNHFLDPSVQPHTLPSGTGICWDATDSNNTLVDNGSTVLTKPLKTDRSITVTGHVSVSPYTCHAWVAP